MTDQKRTPRNVWLRLRLRFLLLSTLASVVLATVGLTIMASPPAPIRRLVDPNIPWGPTYEVTWESDPETMLNIHWDRVVSSPTIRILVAVSLLLMEVLLLQTSASILGTRKS